LHLKKLFVKLKKFIFRSFKISRFYLLQRFNSGGNQKANK